jgi:hypothetical protein
VRCELTPKQVLAVELKHSSKEQHFKVTMSFFGIALFSSLFLFTASSTRGDKPRVLLLGPDGCAKDYPVSLLSCHLKDIIMCIEVASPCTVLSVLFGGGNCHMELCLYYYFFKHNLECSMWAKRMFQICYIWRILTWKVSSDLLHACDRIWTKLPMKLCV